MAEGSSGLITQAPSIDECYYYKPVYPAEVIEEVGFKRERERVVAQERRRRRGPARMPRGLGTGMTTHSWVRPRYLSLVWLRSSRPVAKCGTFFVIVTLTGSWLDTFVMLSTSSARPLWPFSSLSNFFFLSQVVRGPSLNLFELHSRPVANDAGVHSHHEAIHRSCHLKTYVHQAVPAELLRAMHSPVHGGAR